MVYAERKILKYWGDSEVSHIASLFRKMGYVNGFLEAVRLEDDPKGENVILAKSYAKEGIDLIEKYKSLPKDIGNDNIVQRLENLCKTFLSSTGSFSKKVE